jgi:dTDP-4-amino-4,6-dideoxygalactose transaminase
MVTPVKNPRERLAVPLFELQSQYRELETEIMEAMREVCASQQFILGPRVRELEERISAYSHCRYGVGVSSGTDF